MTAAARTSGMADTLPKYSDMERGQRGEGTAEEAQLAKQLVATLRHHELVVAILDALHHFRVLGIGLHRLGLGLELILGDADTLRGAPQLGRIHEGQTTNDLIGLRTRGEVARGHTHPASRRTRVEAGAGEHIDLAFGVGEEPSDVLGLFDVDHPMATAGRPEHGEAPTAVGSQLRVHPRSAAAESPTSSLMRPSRSRRPTPAITVSRG